MGNNHVSEDRESILDLLPAYVLGAATDEERARVEGYLRECRACQHELAVLGAVSQSLPLMVEERDPPERLRQRVLRIAAEEPGAAPAARPAAPPRPLASPPPAALALPERRSRARRLLPLAASVLLAISLGLGAWAAVLRGQLDATTQQLAVVQGQPRVILFNVTGTQAAPNARGEVAYLAQNSTAYLSVENLPPLPPDRAYQVWLIQNGRPVDAGLLPADATARVQADLGQYEAIAISQEPLGGSPQPTGPIVMQGAVTVRNA